ncbi:MAG TPA: hypothetical protein PL183_09135 [Aquamicrobium sp.]|nr:hypothetical protein [Aquamicrobium sp.]
MSPRTFARGFSDFLDLAGSALAVSAAMHRYRQPSPADLKRLGIDPDQFRRIGRS